MHTGKTAVLKDQISIKTPNPKCRLFLKIYQERYLAAVVYLSEAPFPPMTPYSPPPYTLYTCVHCGDCTVYLFTKGKEGGGS